MINNIKKTPESQNGEGFIFSYYPDDLTGADISDLCEWPDIPIPQYSLKIVNDNSTFIDSLATSNVAYDLVEEMYFSHSEDNNSGTNVTLADASTTAVVACANKANGFNSLLGNYIGSF